MRTFYDGDALEAAIGLKASAEGVCAGEGEEAGTVVAVTVFGADEGSH